MERFSSLSAIQNQSIVDPSGEHVGHVRDVLLDLRDGRIEYICIALRDARPGNPAEAVVPWSAVRKLDGTEPRWQVAAGKALLAKIAQPVPSER